MKTENIDGIVKLFGTEIEFIDYARLVWEENEIGDEANIEKPFDFHTSLSYIILYTEIKILW